MKKSKKPTKTSPRKMGDTMLDLEKVLQEMTDPDKHDLQWYEVLTLVHGWLQVHAPHAQEKYISDNSSPIFYYGPK